MFYFLTWVVVTLCSLCRNSPSWTLVIGALYTSVILILKIHIFFPWIFQQVLTISGLMPRDPSYSAEQMEFSTLSLSVSVSFSIFFYPIVEFQLIENRMRVNSKVAPSLTCYGFWQKLLKLPPHQPLVCKVRLIIVLTIIMYNNTCIYYCIMYIICIIIYVYICI